MAHSSEAMGDADEDVGKGQSRPCLLEVESVAPRADVVAAVFRRTRVS